MSAKIDKDELKGPDVFHTVSDKIFEFIEHHFKTFLTAAIAVLVGSVGYVGYGYIESSREESATAALYTAEAPLNKAADQAAEARSKKTKGKDEEAPPSVDYTKDYAPLVENVKAQIKQFSSRRAALISALNLSYFLVQQKQYAEALAVLDLVKFQPSTTDDLFGFLMMHKGVVLLENNQAAAAIDAYQKILASTNLKPFFPEALLKLGVGFEQKGDAGKARETFERVGHEFPETSASSTAQQYLRLLDLKNQKPG